MDPMDTVAIMVGLFLIMGCVIPTVLLMRGKVDNRMMLWMTMAFTIVLIFGVIADFTSLDTSVRMLIIEYGFVLTMVFGVIFGIDLLLQGNYISRVRWKDLDIDTSKMVKGERPKASKGPTPPKASKPKASKPVGVKPKVSNPKPKISIGLKRKDFYAKRKGGHVKR